MFLLLTLALAAAELPAITGVVQVSGGASPTVRLVRKDARRPPRLAGELVRELRNLPSAEVQVVGVEDHGVLVVQGYRILAVGGGARPIAVGVVVPVGDAGLGLSTDDGPAIPLSASPHVRSSLDALVGAKVWIVGRKLLSGEIKVERYGVLLGPLRTGPPPSDEHGRESRRAAPASADRGHA